MLRLAVLSSALLLAGCAIPEPRGATLATANYEVRTDAPRPPFAAQVADAAEHAHTALAEAYGGAPQGTFPVVVYQDRVAFDEQLSPTLKDKGFVGECGDRFALVFWPDEVRGQDTLAHELVHHFNAKLLPDLPYWLDEGLAKALAPKRIHGDWISAVTQLSDDDLRARVRSLAELPDGDDYALRCLVAAALVRHGLETQGFASVVSIRSWQPDTEAFLRWLRARRNASTARRFAPVWGAGPGRPKQFTGISSAAGVPSSSFDRDR